MQITIVEPDAAARYVLVNRFEDIGADVCAYSDYRLALEAIQQGRDTEIGARWLVVSLPSRSAEDATIARLMDAGKDNGYHVLTVFPCPDDDSEWCRSRFADKTLESFSRLTSGRGGVLGLTDVLTQRVVQQS